MKKEDKFKVITNLKIMPFKDTKEGQTNYCIACESEARGYVGEIIHTCGKTNTLDKCPCEKVRCKTSPNCSHNTNGRDLDKPCSIEFPPPPLDNMVKPEGVGEW